ncbi:MAG: lipid-A-disaccharide synthase [Candidatus Muiribacterium halophilum]|uniref:Lipid-A-disaccharide synthase n=1 Tax=Muiribacterium halophilum TaxID=2053465 RepID=A0A2N5ZBQ2_MUIH1|nr:MAG: lipid-A-disaccharide synthase [Candidatus Muirbacterium halophilum]
MRKIGLIAGSGRFPLLLSKEIKNKGCELIVVAIKGAADGDVEKNSDSFHWVELGMMQDMIDIFKENEVNEIMMVGKVNKTILYTNSSFDNRVKGMLETLDEKNDDRLLASIAQEFHKEGINLIDPMEFLRPFFPKAGVLTSKKPDENVKADIDFGFTMAKRLSDMDIGQVVVVKNQIVLAVEAMEGTDKAIPRGAMLGKGDVIVAKVSRPKQDMRFDIPVVGLTTIDTLIKSKASALVIDQNTIILDMEEVIKKADDNNITIFVKSTGRKISRIFISTGELSGDLHASHVISKIRMVNPSVVIDGIGGKYMARHNVNLIENVSNLSEMGFVEVSKSIMKYKKLFERVRKYLLENRPEKVVLLDASGMNFRIGKIAKELGIEVIYYIPPKVWVWKGQGRIKKMKEICDKVICLFDFENEIFESNEMEVSYFGNPLVEIVKEEKKKEQFLMENPEIQDGDKVILLLPGSRNQEIKYLLHNILRSASNLHKKDPSLKFVMLKAQDVKLDIDTSELDFPLIVKEKDSYCWYRFATFGIVASGTATLEAAISNLPMVIVYRVNFLTYWIARVMLDINYVGLPNIIANEEVVPEFIQGDFKPEKIAEFIYDTITDENKYNVIKDKLEKVVMKIQNENILDNIAGKILE